MTIGSRMKERRLNLGYSQTALAQLVTDELRRKKIKRKGRPMTCPQSTISRFELPENNARHLLPDVRILPVLTEVLGVTLNWLITGEDDTTIPQDVLRISYAIVDLPPKKQIGLSYILDVQLAGAPKDLAWQKIPDVHGERRHERKRG